MGSIRPNAFIDSSNNAFYSNVNALFSQTLNSFCLSFLQSQQVTPTSTSQVSTVKPAQYEVKSFVDFSHFVSICLHHLIYLSDGKIPFPVYKFIELLCLHWMLTAVRIFLLGSIQVSVL